MDKECPVRFLAARKWTVREQRVLNRRGAQVVHHGTVGPSLVTVAFQPVPRPVQQNRPAARRCDFLDIPGMIVDENIERDVFFLVTQNYRIEGDTLITQPTSCCSLGLLFHAVQVPG